MNTLELMALNELQRNLQTILDMKVTDNNEIITHEVLVSRIKQKIHSSFTIIMALQENNDKRL